MIGRLNSQFSGQIARLQIPPGYGFQPTDKDLLRSYLRPKVYGEPLDDPDAVKEIDLYQMSPDDIWNKFMEGPPSGNSDLFCFTKLRSTGEQSRFGRTVDGGGTWKQESGRELVYSDDTNGTIIGSRRRFSFMSGEQQRRSGWVMHEYRLHPPHPSPYALCRLHKSRANSHKKKAQPQPQLQVHEQSEIERSEAQSHLQPQLQDTQDEIERNVALVQSQHQDIFGTEMYGSQSRLQTQDEIERNEALVQSQIQDIFGTEISGAQSQTQPPPQYDDSWIGRAAINGI